MEVPAASNNRRRGRRSARPNGFSCRYSTCDKSYSRAEHRARHELNHNPKQVFKCSHPGCSQAFVREDLYNRHQRRHGTNRLDEGRQDHRGMTLPHPLGFDLSRFSEASPSRQPMGPMAASHPQGPVHTDSSLSQTNEIAMQAYVGHETCLASAEAVLQPCSTTAVDCTARSEAVGYTGRPIGNPLGSESLHDFDSGRENFVSWLFGSPGSQDVCYNPEDRPLFDSGLDWNPTDIENTFANVNSKGSDRSRREGHNISTTTSSSSPPYLRVDSIRRWEVGEVLSRFTQRHRTPRAMDSHQPNSRCLNLPHLTEEAIEECLDMYWGNVAAHVPVIHRATFSAIACPVMLLLAMIALGSAHLVLSQPKGSAADYTNLANVIASALRWEILEHEDAQPPVELWVAQALVLMELFEKIYATRKLHERAHIGHSYTLNLLRRGDPMVARSRSESPRDGHTEPSSPDGQANTPDVCEPSPLEWWNRWARDESMRRVVFVAFKMDIYHAVMFGHDAELAPYEVQLSLPCDESIWTADSAEDVQRMQELLATHGFKPTSFLDALKLTLHGQEVHTHVQGRTILFAGLLSVSWHINHRERGLQSLEMQPSKEEHHRWASKITEVFSIWRHSFEKVLLTSQYRGHTSSGIEDPNLLYNFANVARHVDIVDCQILAQSRRLLSRKVSSRDIALVTQRMKTWATTPTGHLAVFYAFQLLKDTVLKAANAPSAGAASPNLVLRYSCRNETVVYWPWTMYLAMLTIWAYEYLSVPGTGQPPQTSPTSHVAPVSAWEYLYASQGMTGPNGVYLLRSRLGCRSLLYALADDFLNAESELLVEAAARMQHCARMLES